MEKEDGHCGRNVLTVALDIFFEEGKCDVVLELFAEVVLWGKGVG